MLNLAEELTQERSQKENRVDNDAQTEETETVDTNMQTEYATKVDTNMQTEYATKVDCDLQTDDIPEVNLNLQPKVDCEVQTANTSDDEFLSKDCEGTRAEEEHTRLDLERRVEQLLDQVRYFSVVVQLEHSVESDVR
ncbi:uncharacterized protein LOC119435222 isoform X3 [Dermacentor silvarum]|uniref:uncharacterized protein LOC119435222 isoform X3 n=1 Tax=Dermacentor silvarum TaxID=543639 RepID=UPI0021007212|nr:uncharacterized protein LOC119435222 isoform X3 [Dermacentor silvarum]